MGNDATGRSCDGQPLARSLDGRNETKTKFVRSKSVRCAVDFTALVSPNCYGCAAPLEAPTTWQSQPRRLLRSLPPLSSSSSSPLPLPSFKLILLSASFCLVSTRGVEREKK